MAYKPALNQFNGGEISPQLEGRFDWDKYNYSAKLCKNFIPLVEGSLKRRGGSHFVYSPETFKTYTLVFKITCDVTPTLTVDGKTVELTNNGNVWTSTQLIYPKGQGANYNIEADGYLPIYDTYYVKNDTTIEKTMELGETVKMYIASFSDDVEVEVNNKKIPLNEYAMLPVSTAGDTSNYKYFRILISYNGKYYDARSFTFQTVQTTLFIALWDNNLITRILAGTSPNISDTYICSENEETIYTIGNSQIGGDMSYSHTVILPKGKYRCKLIGGGGSSFTVADDVYVGGSSGYIRADITVSEYNRKLFVICGEAGIDVSGQTKGGDTSISDISKTLCCAYGGDSDYPNEQGKGGSYYGDEEVYTVEGYDGKGSGDRDLDQNIGYGYGTSVADEEFKHARGYLSIGSEELYLD